MLQAEPVAPPAWYHDLLAPHAAALDIWQTEYLQVLEGEDPVLRWTEATALRPVLQTLDEAAAAAFKDAYAARLREAYPRRPDGTTLFPFLRLFIVATTGVAAGRGDHLQRGAWFARCACHFVL